MKKKGNIQSNNPELLNIIVEGSKLNGDMITQSNLRIDGEINGNISSAAKVVIGKTGLMNGNLTCADADIEGEVKGVLKIDGLLTLRLTAKIEGEITTAKFHVEEGAEFSGNCVMSNHKSTSVSNTMTRATKEDSLEDNLVY